MVTLTKTEQKVAKAPLSMGTQRYNKAKTLIEELDPDKFKSTGNTLISGVRGGVRLDKQGEFTGSDGKKYVNIQLQANNPIGNDLKYPLNTSAQQKGTTVAGVYLLQSLYLTSTDYGETLKEALTSSLNSNQECIKYWYMIS